MSVLVGLRSQYSTRACTCPCTSRVFSLGSGATVRFGGPSSWGRPSALLPAVRAVMPNYSCTLYESLHLTPAPCRWMTRFLPSTFDLHRERTKLGAYSVNSRTKGK